MKKILGAILLFFLCCNYTQAYEINYYKGVKVNHIKRLCGNPIGGCYYYSRAFKGQINMNPHESESSYLYTLSHEYGHHIWWAKMSATERRIWESLATQEVQNLLASKGINSGACHVSDYALIDSVEDFAETVAFYERREQPTKIIDLCDVKLVLVGYFINKHD